MGMKELGNETPMSIRNSSNDPKHRDKRAPIKNMSVPEEATKDKPIRNSVTKRTVRSST